MKKKPALVLDVVIRSNVNNAASGRGIGTRLATKEKVVEHLLNADKLRLLVAEDVTAINFTFFKGFFHEALLHFNVPELLQRLELPQKYAALIIKSIHIENIMMKK